MTANKPHFTIVRNAQKPGSPSFDTIITDDVLQDIVSRLTGQTDYTVTFLDEGYNIGRLAIMKYGNMEYYLSFSIHGTIRGRNYFFQSLTSAIVRFYLSPRPLKRILFYFLPLVGNIETEYYKFMYRLMATAGVEFLNPEVALDNPVLAFTTVDDIINNRDKNRSTNRSNNSTYLTKGINGIPQIYCKTYGANKKEATLFSIAVSRLSPESILYEIIEQNLKELPSPDLEVIQRLGNVSVVPTDLRFEKRLFEENNSLRSPKFTYNLLGRLGPKKCALCGCEVPEIVEGAHIWAVADIKKTPLTIEQQLLHATDGENGLWLCANHHGLLDDDYIRISRTGIIDYRPHIEVYAKQFIDKITLTTRLDPSLLTDNFLGYLDKRNLALADG
jgi:hypothetical protein